MSASKYWIAFGVGVTAGAAVALLYAPQGGVATRDQIKKTFDDAGNYIGDASAYIKDSADKIRETADRFSAQAEGVLNSTRGSVADLVDTVVKRASGEAQKLAKTA